MFDEAEHREQMAVARQVIAFYRHHAEELRAKGLDVDHIIAELEAGIAQSETAAEGLRRAEREEKASVAIAGMARAQTERLAAKAGLYHDAASADYLRDPVVPPRGRGPNPPEPEN